MSPNMDPIYLIKDIPCGDPFDKRNGGDWTAAPSRGGPAWENRTDRTGETDRLGVWYFRFLSEGKNVSTTSGIEASCNLPC